MKPASLLLYCFLVVNALHSEVNVFENALDHSQVLEFKVHSLQTPRLDLGVDENTSTIQWYSGESGITADPLIDETGAELIVDSGDIPGAFWARIVIGSETIDSATFSLSVYQAFDVIPEEGGFLKVTGRNSYGQLGKGFMDYTLVPEKIQEGVKQISIGGLNSFFWKNDGSLWGMGNNSYGQLGIGRDDIQMTTEAYPIEGDWVDVITMSSSMTFFMKENGDLYIAGYDAFKMAFEWNDDRGEETYYAPTFLMSGISNVLSAGVSALYLDNDNNVWHAGYGSYKVGMTSSNTWFQYITDQTKDIAISSQYSLYLKEDGQLMGAGYGPGFSSVNDEVQLVSLASDVMEILSINETSFVYKTNGGDIIEVTSAGSSSPYGNDISKHVGREDYSFYIDGSAQLFGKGSNSTGLLGTDSLFPVDEYTPILDEVLDIKTDSEYSLFLRTNGDLYAAGYSAAFKDLPSLETGLHVLDSGVRSVAVSDSVVYYLKMDDSLWVTGGSPDHILGTPDTSFYSIPTKLLDNVLSVSGSSTHTLILDTSGSVHSVGSNGLGYLGVGDLEARSTFTPLVNGSAVRKIRATEWNSMLLKEDNSLWVMGSTGIRRFDNSFPFSSDFEPYGKLADLEPYKLADNVVDADICNSTWYVDRFGDLYGIGEVFDNLSNIGIDYEEGVPYLMASGVVAVSSSDSGTVFLCWDGTLWVLGGDRFFSNVAPLESGSSLNYQPTLIDRGVRAAVVDDAMVLYSKENNTNWVTGFFSPRFGDYLESYMSASRLNVLQGMSLSGFSLGKNNSAFIVPELTLPNLIGSLEDVALTIGSDVQLSLQGNGDQYTYQWYRGIKGDKSNPVEGAVNITFPVEVYSDASFWLEASNEIGVFQSESVQVSVNNPQYVQWIEALGFSWEMSHPRDNSDFDVYDNFSEFVFDENPRSGMSFPIIGYFDKQTDSLIFKHKRHENAESFISYKVSTDLNAWSDLPLESTIIFDQGSGEVTITIPSSEFTVPRFLSIIVSR